uniref:Uncharacterized protein n=1 Tax=Romanomermis culicivorax TaxID=13658 RepID=A0A915KJH7_ROMCU
MRAKIRHAWSTEPLITVKGERLIFSREKLSRELSARNTRRAT